MNFLFKVLVSFCLLVTCVRATETIAIETENSTETTIVNNAKEEVQEEIQNGVEEKQPNEVQIRPQPMLSTHRFSLWPTIEKDDDLLLLEQVLEDIEKGRGKSHRYKKFTKFMYPLFMGVLIAKIILIPLILKMLTAISATALVLGKISLITTGFLALKWIFAGNVYDTKDRFEIIYLPSSNGKPYRSAAGGFSLLDDQTWSDSNNQYVATAATVDGQQKYIPVTLKHELPYNAYRYAGGRDGGNSIKDLYYYAQHNFNKGNNNNKNNDGKPFL